MMVSGLKIVGIEGSQQARGSSFLKEEGRSVIMSFHPPPRGGQTQR